MAPYAKSDPFVLVCGEIIKHTREVIKKRDKREKYTKVVPIEEVDHFLDSHPEYYAG
jgi:hypothetical protein